MKRTLLGLAALVLMLAGCNKDINNKDALRAALLDYYKSNEAKMGLSMDQMDVDVGSMTFQKDEAQAMVSIKPKAGGEGMTMSKVFDRKGDKWVVRAGPSGANPAGHGAGVPVPPSGGAALPPGHPPTKQ